MPITPITPATPYRKNSVKKSVSNSMSQSYSSQPISFKAGRFGYGLDAVPKSVLSKINDISLGTWDRNVVCEVFDSLMKEIKNSDKFDITSGFGELYEIYKYNGLKRTLEILGYNKSEKLRMVMGTNARNTEKNLVTQKASSVDVVKIKNKGPWGILNNLFNLDAKNEIKIIFADKDYNRLTFGLDKIGDYVIKVSKDEGLQEYSYFANKDKIKEQIYPKIDLYLPPGV